MKPLFKTVRAVGTEFVTRSVRALIVPFGIGAVLVGGLSWWLIHFSKWWLAVTTPLLLAVVFGISLLLSALLVVRMFSPKLSSAQHLGVQEFVDKLQRVSEKVQLPMFLIVFQVVRDIVRPRDNGYIAQLSKDSASLHKDFLQLHSLF